MEFLEEAVRFGEERGAAHVEARAQSYTRTVITVKDGKVEVVKEGFEEGAAVRVLVRGAKGFSTTGALNPESLRGSVSEAVKMARVASGLVKEPIRLSEVKAVVDEVEVHPKIDPRSIPLQQKIALLEEMDRKLFAYDPRIRSCTLDYVEITGETAFRNSDGAALRQGRLHVWMGVSVTAREGDVLASSREELGTTRGYELFETETPDRVAGRVGERAIKQLGAVTPKGGVFPAVIGTNVVGVFVHEAFGHLAEADLALSGSVLGGRMGERIASPQVTIYDDGTVEGGFGSYRYDDEGVPSTKALLVEGGVLVGLMHSRETAAKLGAAPTGNARAEDFRHEPLIRMRNTYLKPGEMRFEELFEGIPHGYYLKSLRGGQANLDGTFQVGIQEAYEIVKGEVGRPVRGVSISGSTLETLRQVEGVGRGMELWAGRCGKGQTAFIGDGGPPIRVREVQIGGGA